MGEGEGQPSMLNHDNARASQNHGWLNHNEKNIPGVRNTLGDGISRFPRVIPADKVSELTNPDE